MEIPARRAKTPPSTGPTGAPYPDLARYLEQAAQLPTCTLDEARGRAREARRRLDRARRAITWLGRGAVWGLRLAVLGLALPWFFLPWSQALLTLALVSVLGCMLLGIADLETRKLQLGVVTGATLLLAFAARQLALPVLFTGALLALAFQWFTSVKRDYKLATLAWLEAEPDPIGAIEEARAHERHRTLGIERFGRPGYRRSFRVTTSRRQRRVQLVPDPGGLRPKKKTVRVEAARLDHRVDLSSLDEFHVCCFLGGSQDSSAFDFLLAPSLAWFDLVSPKGRTLRALLMACVTEEGRPLLVANAVFGRHGGGVGSTRDDDRFLRGEIEAYARYAGFERVLFSTTPTNSRPRDFVDTLRHDGVGEPVALACRLTVPTRPLKLEIFDRSEPGGSVYGMLIREMLGGAETFALGGTVFGRLVECGPRPEEHGEWEALEPLEQELEEAVLERMLPLSESGVGARLVERALARRYDPGKVFKPKELAGFLKGKDPHRSSLELAEQFLAGKVESFQGFRERFLAGLEGLRRDMVLASMATRLAGTLEQLLWLERTSAAPALADCPRLREEARAFRKLVSRYRVALTPEQEEKLVALEARFQLAARLDQADQVLRRSWWEPLAARLESLNRGRYS